MSLPTAPKADVTGSAAFTIYLTFYLAFYLALINKTLRHLTHILHLLSF